MIDRDSFYHSSKIFFVGIAMSIIGAKLLMMFFVLTSDSVQLYDYAKKSLFKKKKHEYSRSRAKFILQVGGLFATSFFGTLVYGMAVGAYRLHKKRVNVYIPNLPDELEGLKIVQISDLHLGSFTTTEPIEHAVKAINEEQADIFVFTGDLVNDKAIEIQPFKEELKKIQSRYGNFSILGNHDYGSYVPWKNETDKQNNLLDQIQTQKEIGWDILLNENRILDIHGKKLALLGVEYWGKSARWEKKHGDIDQANEGAHQADVKILLTHDPSHWDMIISQDKRYQDIALSLAGHTHGFQFGVEIPGFKWSPSQYAYPRWAGLYKERNQYLYVNRGLGFLGYPGRVGIPPEITILTLTKEAHLASTSNA